MRLHTYIVKRSFVIILFILALSKTRSQETTSVNSHSTTDKRSEQLKIAVVTLRIAKNDSHYSVSIKNMTLVNTTKTFLNEKPGKINDDDLVCYILGKNKRTIDTLKILQPLKARYEYPNEDGTIGTKTVDLPENEVLLRFNYNTGMKYLRVAKARKNKKLKKVATLVLPELN